MDLVIPLPHSLLQVPRVQVWVCTAAVSPWGAASALHVLPSPDALCHPRAGTTLLQDVAAGCCPVHASVTKGDKPKDLLLCTEPLGLCGSAMPGRDTEAEQGLPDP